MKRPIPYASDGIGLFIVTECLNELLCIRVPVFSIKTILMTDFKIMYLNSLMYKSAKNKCNVLSLK